MQTERIDTEYDDLIQRLVDARTTGTLVDATYVPPPLADVDAVYAAQQQIVKRTGATIGGWKVGAPSLDSPPNGAPLPSTGLHPSGATLARSDFRPGGLELEIAFRFGRVFAPQPTPYTDAEIIGGIAEMAAAIEVVASRYAAWPNVPKSATLTDLGTHGALVVGAFSPYQDDYPYLGPSVQLTLDGQDVLASLLDKPAANPGGDPRRFLTWFVNHSAVTMGIPVTPDLIVTSGTYTGLFVPPHAGRIDGVVAGLAPVSLTLR